MSTFVVKAERREAGRPRATRRAGSVPAIVYGGGDENVAVQVSAQDVLHLFSRQGGRGLLELEIDGKPQTVMIKEVQRHPVRQDVLHIDFLRVRMTEKIQAAVPLRLEGEEAVTRAGAVLQQQLREIHVSCLPADLPAELVCDLSHLEPGATLTVGQLQVPAGVEILNDPDQVVAVALLPRGTQADADDEAAGEAAEPAGDDAGEGDETGDEA
ncbi:MAG TPA: 50S ribosomal protein L25 [Bacillota bacterium]